ncbi:MAG: response regulator [Anaerolineales bacterium]|jgi:pilus assembly protein CpaE
MELNKKRILVVDDDPVMRNLCSGLLTKEGYLVALAEHGKEGLSQVQSFKPDLIVSDVLMPEMDGYQFCTQVRAIPEGKSIPIIILTALDSVEQKIMGFDVGADDYIVKPFEPKEFLARLALLIRRREELEKYKIEEIKAKTIAVFSLRGGAGVSTLAANLAVGLSRIWRYPTTLVDMVMTGGQSALYLNQPLINTWSEIAQFPVEEVDKEAVQSALLPHESGVYTLASPRRPECAETVTPGIVSKTLNILKNQNEYLVLDLPHDFKETTLAGLDIADQKIIVLQPEVISIRGAIVALDTFENLGYPPDDILLVLNWTFPRKGIAIEDIERSMKKKIGIVIPYASEALVDALNYGMPLALSHPEDPLAMLFEDIAYIVSKEAHQKERPGNPSPAWEKVTKRLRQKKRDR